SEGYPRPGPPGGRPPRPARRATGTWLRAALPRLARLALSRYGKLSAVPGIDGHGPTTRQARTGLLTAVLTRAVLAAPGLARNGLLTSAGRPACLARV
ncbi:hypothetical protein AAHZ94_35225, partial [Streptomyces sp. HSW2009]